MNIAVVILEHCQNLPSIVWFQHCQNLPSIVSESLCGADVHVGSGLLPISDSNSVVGDVDNLWLASDNGGTAF